MGQALPMRRLEFSAVQTRCRMRPVPLELFCVDTVRCLLTAMSLLYCKWCTWCTLYLQIADCICSLNTSDPRIIDDRIGAIRLRLRLRTTRYIRTSYSTRRSRIDLPCSSDVFRCDD